MTTRIVEIPVPFVQDGEHTKNHKRPSVDIEGFLNNDFSNYLNNEDARALNSVPNSALQIQRTDSNNSISSTGSFYLDLDDFSSSLYLNGTEEDDFLSPLSGNEIPPFPESPSMEDLRNKLGNMKTSSMTGQKQEKEEDNEDESSSSSSDNNSEVDDESEELLKKGYSDDEPLSAIKDEVDERIRPVKKTRVGPQRNDSFSSISSYSSGGSSDEENELEDDFENDDYFEDDEEDPLMGGNKKRVAVGPKKYKQPASLRADDLTIGTWNMKELCDNDDEEITFDVKILFGRRKIKYEISKPQRGSKHRLILAMDFPFNFISGLEFRAKDHEIVFQLSERPTFSKKEKGKCSRTTDFTTNLQATSYMKHHVLVEDNFGFTDFMERLLGCDRRLRQLAKVGVSNSEPTFPAERFGNATIPPCDWDKDQYATKHCEDCKANYCDVCDDVLHRHETHRTHRRIPVQLIMKPIAIPKPKKNCTKKRKKMNNDRCRCGTGATKGTLGEPCTGNRCPCFSAGKSCTSCGCKGCANPLKRNPRSPAYSNSVSRQQLTASV